MYSKEHTDMIKSIRKSISDGFGVGFYMGDLSPDNHDENHVPKDIQENSIYTEYVELDVNSYGQVIVKFDCKLSDITHSILFDECKPRLIYQLKEMSGYSSREEALATAKAIKTISDRHNLDIEVNIVDNKEEV